MREAVELVTLEPVSWFDHHRLLEAVGYIPSAEAEANYCRQFARAGHASLSLTYRPSGKPGRFTLPDLLGVSAILKMGVVFRRRPSDIES